MRESPRSPALLAQFISEENAPNSYPGVFKRWVRCEESGRRRCCAVQNPSCGVFLEAPGMSRGDRFASAIVRHVCGVRGVSAKVALVRAQRVWRTVRKSTDERVDGGNEEKHRSRGSKTNAPLLQGARVIITPRENEQERKDGKRERDLVALTQRQQKVQESKQCNATTFRFSKRMQ